MGGQRQNRQNISKSAKTSTARKVKSVGTKKTEMELHAHEFIPPFPTITAEHIEAYMQKVKIIGTDKLMDPYAYEFIPPLRVGALLLTEDIKEYMQRVKSNGADKASIQKGLRLKHQVSLQHNDKTAMDPNTHKLISPLRVGAKLTTEEKKSHMQKVKSVGTVVLHANETQKTTDQKAKIIPEVNLKQQVRLQHNDKTLMDPIVHKFISPLRVEAKITTDDINAHMQKVKSFGTSIVLHTNETQQTTLQKEKITPGLILRQQLMLQRNDNKPSVDSNAHKFISPLRVDVKEHMQNVKSVAIDKPAVELDANKTLQTIVQSGKIMSGMLLKHQNICESASASAACKVKAVGTDKLEIHAHKFNPALRVEAKVTTDKVKSVNTDKTSVILPANERQESTVQNAKIMTGIRLKHQNICESAITSAAYKVKSVGTRPMMHRDAYEFIPPMRMEANVTNKDIEAYVPKVVKINKRNEEWRLAFEKTIEKEIDVDLGSFYNKICDPTTEKSLQLLEERKMSKLVALKSILRRVEKLEKIKLHIENVEEKLLAKGIKVDTNDEDDDMGAGDFEDFYDELLKNGLFGEPLKPLEALPAETPKRQDHQHTKPSKISATSTPVTRKSAKDEYVEKSKVNVTKPHDIDITKPHGTHISKTKNASKNDILDTFVADENGMVVIGPNGTTISKKALAAINWSLAGGVFTRKILMEIFDRETLAFHSLSGKPSPAFRDCNKPKKSQLNPFKVADVIHFVMQHKNLTAKMVRNIITTKCADENKLFRQRENKSMVAAEKLLDDEIDVGKDITI